MNREEYVSMRQTKQYDIGLFYKYYLQNAKKTTPLPLNLFNQVFQIFFQANAKEVIEKLDTKYEIFILTDINGKEIKVW